MERDFFETIVAGENPLTLIAPYDNKIEVDNYIVYRYRDAKKLKEDKLKIYQQIISSNVSPATSEFYKEEYDELKDMDIDDAYFYLTSEYDYDENNNAISNRNPKGKYSFYQKGKLFSVPFITLDGREVFQARKKEIDWSRMHLSNSEAYRIAWETVMEHKQPKNGFEENRSYRS